MRTQNKRHILSNGIINPDDSFAKKIGFTSGKFEGYLYKDGNEIWVPFIKSLDEGQGNLRKLFEAIEARGYKVVVTTPFKTMTSILKGFGFIPEQRRWLSSDDYDIDKPNPLGYVWERHKMGLKMQGLKFSMDEMVEVWIKPEIHA